MFGKKRLDSENANYSYGSLQEVLDLGLSKLDLTNVKNILLLGLGGGCVVHSLRKKFDFKQLIRAVEIDNDVISIAKNDFKISENEQLVIVNKDAYEEVFSAQDKYDLIIVDLFIDNKVPIQFYGQQFWKQLYQLLNQEGTIVFNAGFEKEAKPYINGLKGHSGNIFSFQRINHKSYSNTLLLIKKRWGKVQETLQAFYIPFFSIEFLEVIAII